MRFHSQAAAGSVMHCLCLVHKLKVIQNSNILLRALQSSESHTIKVTEKELSLIPQQLHSAGLTAEHPDFTVKLHSCEFKELLIKHSLR